MHPISDAWVTIIYGKMQCVITYLYKGLHINCYEHFCTFMHTIFFMWFSERKKINQSIQSQFWMNGSAKNVFGLIWYDLFSNLQGKPQPIVSWLKDGQPIDTKKVNIRNSDKDSIFFIRASERADSGVYEMCVKVDSFEDKSEIILQIVGRCYKRSYTSWTVVDLSCGSFF